jgi:hypothetical protein
MIGLHSVSPSPVLGFAHRRACEPALVTLGFPYDCWRALSVMYLSRANDIGLAAKRCHAGVRDLSLLHRRERAHIRYQGGLRQSLMESKLILKGAGHLSPKLRDFVRLFRIR